MSTKHRREREFAERELLFIDTAYRLMAEEGLLSLQMNRIAKECDYSVGTLYQHFISKEDLLLAMLTARAAERIQLFGRVANWTGSSRERIIAFVVADVCFTRQQPLFFHLNQYISTRVISAATSPGQRDAAFRAYKPLADLFQGVIDEAVNRGEISSTLTSYQLGAGLWSLTEGMHNLVHAQGLLETYQIANPYSLLFYHVNALLNGLGWQPLQDPNDAEQSSTLIKRIVDEVFADLGFSAHSLFPQIDQDVL
ncbi:MAG: hypothetical protein VR73_05995 [Gammaproteobacteria bacterium BRH_c0]|nr:MAG: hypothetical protein VR73_05995 [Gammaproteobacteria bacterium BRH_c0]